MSGMETTAARRCARPGRSSPARAGASIAGPQLCGLQRRRHVSRHRRHLHGFASLSEERWKGMSSSAPGMAAGSSTCATDARSRCPAPPITSTPAASKTAWCGSTLSTAEKGLRHGRPRFAHPTRPHRRRRGSGLDARIKFNSPGNDGFLFIDGKSQPSQVIATQRRAPGHRAHGPDGELPAHHRQGSSIPSSP